ncbi:uncharacterized protein B0H64DRAFT_408351 [Chaetomium fimeti]|uniref:Uncharacterized protein n=1 Tax=Chaetomium fimeti TaxID=1854472 RepID=A0AAE0H8H5_9PEZI|nr:hypothetical protein B0H64DRAFT_408351 [Chaetomium fimeti]
MDGEAKAESIFEFLTARNPDIHYQTPHSKSLTTVRNSLYPRQLKTWDEFSFSTLETVYGRRLIDEARKGRSSLAYPSVLATIDDVVHDEPTTTHALTVWNHRIVATSLQAVQGTLHPSIWVPRRRKGQHETDKKTTKESTRLEPDAGAVSICQNCCSETERLPKDYKVASKWRSSAIFGGWMTGKAGKWTPGQASKPEAKPIRQVYTYCVKFGCRYGCIITTQEAFIFRIKLRTEVSVADANGDSSRDEAALRQALSTNGLMEYVSIPWENHRQGSSNEYRALTVNLALWFVHILAGNAHEVDWNYPNLWEEHLATGVCTTNDASENSEPETDREDSEPPQARRSFKLGSYSKKRRRDSGVSDDPHYSFAAVFESFTTQVPLLSLQ